MMLSFSKLRWLGFSQVTLLFILGNMISYMLVPNFNLIKDDLGVSDTYLGLLTSGFILMNGFAALLWSYTSDAKGILRRVLLVTSFVSGGLLVTLASVSTHPIAFAFFWTLAGGSLGAIIPLGFSLISDLFDRSTRTEVFMLWYFIGGWGLAIGYGLSLFLGQYYNWRYPLLIGGLTLIVLGGGVSSLIWEPQKGLADVSVSAESYRYPYKFRPQDLGLILSNKSNIHTALQGFFGTISNGILGTWAVHYLIREAKASEVAASVFLGLVGTGALGGLILSHLADSLYKRRPAYRPLIAAFCSITESILFIVFFATPMKLNIYTDDPIEAFNALVSLLRNNTTVLILSVVFFTAMFFNAPVGAIRESVLSDVNLPEDRATVLAAMNIGELMAKSVGISIVGVLSDALGSLRISIVALMTAWFISGIFWIFVAKHYHRDILRIKSILETRVNQIKQMNCNSANTSP